MNHSETLFTELTPHEEATMSGGVKPRKYEKRNNLPKSLIININFIIINFLGNINGAGGGAGSGGAILGNSGDATGGDGVVIFG